MRRSVLRTLGAVAAAALAVTIAGPLAPAEAATTTRYIVTTDSAGAATAKVTKLRAARAPIGHRYSHVFHGFSASLTAAQVRQLKADPTVEAVRPVSALHAVKVTGSA